MVNVINCKTRIEVPIKALLIKASKQASKQASKAKANAALGGRGVSAPPTAAARASLQSLFILLFFRSSIPFSGVLRMCVVLLRGLFLSFGGRTDEG